MHDRCNLAIETMRCRCRALLHFRFSGNLESTMWSTGSDQQACQGQCLAHQNLQAILLCRFRSEHGLRRVSLCCLIRHSFTVSRCWLWKVAPWPFEQRRCGTREWHEHAIVRKK